MSDLREDEQNEFVPLAAYTEDEFEAWGEIEAEAGKALKHRSKGMDIPNVKFQPRGNDIVVFRFKAKEQTTKAGVIMPSETMYKSEEGIHRFEDQIVNVGLLIKAGLRARDVLRSEGMFIGDIVKWGKFSGEEESVHWFTGGDDGAIGGNKDILLISAKDLRGSFDLDRRLWGEEPTLKIVFVADSEGRGMHIMKPITKEEK